MMMNSPIAARRYSRWQTRKRTFVLDDSTSGNSKKTSNHEVISEETTGEADNLTFDRKSQLKLSDVDKHALVSLSQNATVSKTDKDSEGLIGKHVDETTSDTSNLCNRSVSSGINCKETPSEVNNLACVKDIERDNIKNVINGFEHFSGVVNNEDSNSNSQSHSSEKENSESVSSIATTSVCNIISQDNTRDEKTHSSHCLENTSIKETNTNNSKLLPSQKEVSCQQDDRDSVLSERDALTAPSSNVPCDRKIVKIPIGSEIWADNPLAPNLSHSLKDSSKRRSKKIRLRSSSSGKSQDEEASQGSDSRGSVLSDKDDISTVSQDYPNQETSKKDPVIETNPSAVLENLTDKETSHIEKGSQKNVKLSAVSFSENRKSMHVNNSVLSDEGKDIYATEIVSSSSRSMRDRSTLKKLSVVQYPVEFLGSKEKRSLSSKAKRILFKCSSANKSISNESNSISQDKVEATIHANGTVSGADKIDFKDNLSGHNSYISKDASKEKHLNPNKATGGRFSSEEISGSMESQVELSSQKKSNQNVFISQQVRQRHKNSRKKGSDTAVEADRRSSVVDLDLEESYNKAKPKIKDKSISSPKNLKTDGKRKRSMSIHKFGQNEERFSFSKPKSEESVSIEMEIERLDNLNTSHGRSLRNRNSLTKSGVVQYPIEFLSSAQKKNLSSKAKEILMNVSVNNQQTSDTKVNVEIVGNANENLLKRKGKAVIVKEYLKNKSPHFNGNDKRNVITSNREKEKKLKIKAKHSRPCVKNSKKASRKYSLPKRQMRGLAVTVSYSTENVSHFDKIAQSLVNADSIQMDLDNKQPERTESDDHAIEKETVSDNLPASNTLEDTVCGVYKTGKKRKNLFTDFEQASKLPKIDEVRQLSRNQSVEEAGFHHTHHLAKTDDIRVTQTKSRGKSKANNTKSNPNEMFKSKGKRSISREPVAVGDKSVHLKDQTFPSRLKSLKSTGTGQSEVITEWISAFKGLVGQMGM